MKLSLRGTGRRVSRYLFERKLPRLNAFDHGITGDGVTDDVAAIEAFLALGVNPNPKHFYFPQPPVAYRLSRAVVVPFIPRSKISGDGPGVTIFAPDNGAGGFRFRTDLTHGITCKGFSVNWAAVQTVLAATAFHYGVTGGSAAGFFSHSYTDITVQFAYNGFALEESDGVQCIWNCAWKNVRLYDVKHHGFIFAPAVATGMPELSFDHVFIENTGGDAPLSTGYAFKFTGCEVVMNNVGVEGWAHASAFNLSGGGHCIINGMHIESHIFMTAFSYVMEVFANTPVVVDGFSIQGATTAACTDAVILFSTSANAMLTVKNGNHAVTTTLGTSYIREVVWANSDVTQTVEVDRVIKTAGGINQPLTGPRATESATSLIQIGMLASSSRVGVAAPLLRLSHIEALPAASATYRGEIRAVWGAPGVLDRWVVCRKDAADAYAWVDLF